MSEAVAIERVRDCGSSLLQVWLLAETESEHVAKLLRWMTPPLHADVIDAGCGIGGVARLMGRMRKDLTFLLLNNKEIEFSLCVDLVRPQYLQHVADMVDTGLPSECADVVMANYSLGYVDLNAAMREFNRLLRPGGIVFIYDIAGDGPEFEQYLGYRVRPVSDYISAANRNGFVTSMRLSPPANHDQFDRIVEPDPAEIREALSDALESRVQPTVLKFTKA